MKILWVALVCYLLFALTSASFTFNDTLTDIAADAAELIKEDSKSIAWRLANEILPMHYINTVVNEFEIFIVILIVLMIALFACSYYLASFVFYVGLIILTIFIQTLYLFFTLSFFGKTFK